MGSLEIKTIFTLTLFGKEIPITETVIVSWGVMIILIITSLALTRRLKTIPTGAQAILETGIEFLNNFAKKQFGPFAKYLGPYIGSLFLFILTSNVIGFITPLEIKAFGHEFVPPFPIRPPTRDINVTGAFAVVSVFLVLICGIAAKGGRGWLKSFLHPAPIMLPFHILDYFTRTMSLALRLFGNILGGFVMMGLIEKLLPIGIPAVAGIYFDFFDGMLQAIIFVFLTSLYLSEAVIVNE
ncbi:MAG: F0F1 ATP synthase subunit A [Treponema sp.]|jgi:F-type H+-transporting ATPase subunit a|nr:F0F1 ATP synthase subunit A [Treponema sp.]